MDVQAQLCVVSSVKGIFKRKFDSFFGFGLKDTVSTACVAALEQPFQL